MAHWLRDQSLKSMDLVAHELRLLVETLRESGSHDQLNLEGLAGLEIVARRVQRITEAYPKTQESKWGTARFLLGLPQQ